MKKRPLIMGTLSLALIGGVVTYGPEIYWWATHERVLQTRETTVGWHTIRRGSNGRREGEFRSWHRDSGLLASEGWWAISPDSSRFQAYSPTGAPYVTVDLSGEFDTHGQEEDAQLAALQTIPTAPWIQLGVSVDEWIANWETRE